MTSSDLRTFRKQLRLSQPEFAARLGISVSYLADLESGKRRKTGEPFPVPRLIELACMAPASVWLT